MELTKEVLETTKREAVARRDQLLAEVNVCQGRIQAIEAMIAHLDKPEPEPPKDKKVN